MSGDRPKIRAVFDCMVFLQGAARRESVAGACLLLVELGAIELCLSEAILCEIRDVLMRPRIRQQFPALSDELVEGFLIAIEKRAVVISEVPRVFVYDRDPKDEPYINLANPDGGRLQLHAQHLRILDPISFLIEVRSSMQPTV